MLYVGRRVLTCGYFCGDTGAAPTIVARMRVLPTMAMATLARGALLDPMALLQNKASQPTSLRPYLPAAQNGGLECATLALG